EAGTNIQANDYNRVSRSDPADSVSISVSINSDIRSVTRRYRRQRERQLRGRAPMIDDLDFKDSKQKRLAVFASRIVELLEKPDVQNNEPLVSVLDDLLGAVYALIAARQENFRGKMGKSEFPPILNRAKLIAAGTPKNSGNWMAGFISTARCLESPRYSTACRNRWLAANTAKGAVSTERPRDI